MEWHVVQRKRGSAARTAAADGGGRHRLPSKHVNAGGQDAGGAVAPTFIGNGASSESERKKIYEKLSGAEDKEEEEEEQRLVEKMQRAIAKVEASTFFGIFMQQVQDLEVVENLTTRSRLRESAPVADDRMDVNDDDEEEIRSKREGQENLDDGAVVDLVVYGVGSISSSEISRCQLSLALLLKRSFAAIRSASVYDPVMSTVDCRVIMRLGGSPLVDGNDGGRRSFRGPTLAYMPHCDVELYESVLQANLTSESAGEFVILGNSFRTYQERWSVCPLPPGERPVRLLSVQPTVEEVRVPDGFSPNAFNDTSWHFFQRVDLPEFPSVNPVP